jgi:hypothetical protein
MMMSYWPGEVWIQIRDGSIVLLLSFGSLENRVCLSRGVQVAGAAWHAVMRIVAGVGDLVQRIEDDRTGRVLGGRVIERSSDVVYGLCRAYGDEERGFLDWASKSRSTVCPWFGLKTTGTVSPVWPLNQWRRFLGWASKPRWLRVFRFGLQNRQLRFGDLGLKIIAIFFWFGPQNQAGFGLSVAPQNRREGAMVWDTRRDLAAYFAWKQVWLEFFSLALRLGEAWCWMVHMTPSWRLRRNQVEDGRVDVMVYIELFYPTFVIFIVLGTRGIVIFYSFACVYK